MVTSITFRARRMLGTALAGEFKDLQDTALVDAEIVVAPTEGVAVRSLHRVIPDVVDYALSGTSEITASVGDILRDPRTHLGTSSTWCCLLVRKARSVSLGYLFDTVRPGMRCSGRTTMRTLS